MKFVFYTILVVCLLTSFAQPGFSEKPLRLFFEKNTVVPQQEGPKYTVQEGEWLFKILLSKGYTHSQIHKLLPAIQDRNPHIEDINHLKPGQTLYLPPDTTQAQRLPEPKVSQPPTPSATPGSAEQKSYLVQENDTVVTMLQQQGISDALIFKKYLAQFQKLNPDVTDINVLRIGQHVTLPSLNLSDAGTLKTPSNATSAHNKPFATSAAYPLDFDTANRTTPIPVTPTEMPTSELGASNATESTEKETRTPTAGLPFVKTILGQMRFTFASGDEELYPLPDSTWLHVKIRETPLATTPWKNKVIFCPIPKNDEWISQANTLNMHVCTVSPSWGLPEILQKLSAKFPDHFRIWEPGRELTLSRNNLGLTVRSPHTVIIQRLDQKNVYIVWGRKDAQEPPLPQGLPEVLEGMQVKIIELDHFNEPSRLPGKPKHSVYIPVATHLDIIRAMKSKSPEELFGPTLPEDLNALLRLLKSKDMLRQGFANLSWSGGIDRRITLQVPAWTIDPLSNKVILLDKRFADEYLVSLLAHEGYSCFVLPD